jgi:hypothetical protein
MPPSKHVALLLANLIHKQTTEHLLLSILTTPSTTLSYLESLQFPVHSAVNRLSSLPWINDPPRKPTDAFVAVVYMAGQRVVLRNTHPLQAPAIIETKREFHTEDLLLSLLLHPRSIGRWIMEEVSPEGLDLRASLIARMPVGREEAMYLARSLRDQSDQDAAGVWTEYFHMGADATPAPKHDANKPPPAPLAPLPSLSDPELAEKVRGPTAESNWLIPGRVIVGECPGGWDGNPAEDVAAIAAAGATTFVSLLEFRPDYLELLARQGQPPLVSLRFPIDDFSVTNDKDTVAFVGELAKRVAKDSGIL